MANIHNFENDFRLQIENIVPAIKARHIREESRFSELTLPLYSILGAVNRVLSAEGNDYFGIEYSRAPQMDAHYIHTIDIEIHNLVDAYKFNIFWVGGDSTWITINGVEDFLHHLGAAKLKGVIHDIHKSEVRVDLDVDPQGLAQAFAGIFVEFFAE